MKRIVSIPGTALRLLLVGGIVSVLGSGCTDTTNPPEVVPPGSETSSSCVNCHRDQDLLIASADPDTTPPPADSGEG